MKLKQPKLEFPVQYSPGHIDSNNSSFQPIMRAVNCVDGWVANTICTIALTAAIPQFYSLRLIHVLENYLMCL